MTAYENAVERKPLTNKRNNLMLNPFARFWNFLCKKTWCLIFDFWHQHISPALCRRDLYIQKDGRVHLHYLEYYLTDGCNLRCEHCLNFNPFRSGITPKAEMFASFTDWSQKVVPRILRLLGGEPLLHPDFTEIVLAARKAFPLSKVIVTTNGILLPKISDETFRLFAENNIRFTISAHLDSPEYRTTLQQSLKRFRRFGIKYSVEYTLVQWFQQFLLNDFGEPIPHMTADVRKAYSNCIGKQCVAAVGSRLYRCSAVANAAEAVKTRSIGSEWNLVLSHRPMTPANTAEDIYRFLNSGAMPECTICPEKWTTVSSRQIPHEELSQIKKRIAESWSRNSRQ